MLYRCSPSAFYNVVKKFSNKQKDAICSIGLGSLLQIHEKIHLRRHIIDFVVEYYSLKSGAVIVDNTTVPISLTDMVLCFGLPMVGSQIILEGNKELIRELCDHYQIKGSYIYKVTLEKMLKVDDREAICRVKNGKVANVGGFVLFLQHVEVEKELARGELHNTQMSCIIEDLRQKIVTQDTIIETLQEQLSKKETSTENEFNKRSVHESIYVSASLVKRGAVHSMAIGSAQRLLFLRSDSKEMNMLGSTVAIRVVINSWVKRRTHKRKCYKSYADELPTHQRIKLRKAISTLPRQLTRPSLFPSLTAFQKVAVDDAQRCDDIHSMRIIRDRGSIVVGDFFPFIHLTSTSRNKKTRHPSVLLGMVVWEQRCNDGKHRQHGERRGIASSYNSGVVLVKMVDRG
ncbi:hypothetical protein HHK36_032372 [Tetracentron sinense]|uniref:Uncharacterized protein n=1 Tax=Tetracentron sinense TaxID=13715 RepID=A0A834Y989_TETSI|nr:hypothetical protein HHK36_032372 [Tetracentron sinense]